jgi:hypothetical protein
MRTPAGGNGVKLKKIPGYRRVLFATGLDIAIKKFRTKHHPYCPLEFEPAYGPARLAVSSPIPLVR